MSARQMMASHREEPSPSLSRVVAQIINLPGLVGEDSVTGYQVRLLDGSIVADGERVVF